MSEGDARVPLLIWRARALTAASAAHRSTWQDGGDDRGGDEERVKPIFEGFTARKMDFVADHGCLCWERPTAGDGGPTAADRDFRESRDQIPGLQGDQAPAARDLSGWQWAHVRGGGKCLRGDRRAFILIYRYAQISC